mmetsp:Transcript_29953/g.95588  ORF Transcript_29953/g.95588 Transcript_29953/m.95588 type:complete len:264 (-) Transcript_29953:36-827(-)
MPWLAPARCPRLTALLLLAAAQASHGVALHAVQRGAAMDSPDLTAYDPKELLCSEGESIKEWCSSWLKCIKEKAAPEGTQASVLAAWKPANCNVVCGKWPAASLLESRLRGKGAAGANASAVSTSAGSRRDCPTSCKNFQESLSSCVAKILFEPGKVAAMGMPEETPAKSPAHCNGEHTACLPDLPLRYQKCLSKASQPSKECNMLKTDVEDCQDCPQLNPTYLSQYQSFVGGCMSQLHAYHQATHPDAGSAALPGAAGCNVH